jgi:hypothetical protein
MRSSRPLFPRPAATGVNPTATTEPASSAGRLTAAATTRCSSSTRPVLNARAASAGRPIVTRGRWLPSASVQRRDRGRRCGRRAILVACSMNGQRLAGTRRVRCVGLRSPRLVAQSSVVVRSWCDLLLRSSETSGRWRSKDLLIAEEGEAFASRTPLMRLTFPADGVETGRGLLRVGRLRLGFHESVVVRATAPWKPLAECSHRRLRSHERHGRHPAGDGP